MKFCSLYSGSSGNSIFLSTDNTKILIDAGMAGKHLDFALKEIEQDPSEIDAIFITHEHIDHIKGAGIMSRKYDIPIYANEGTWIAMEKKVGKIREDNIRVIKDRCISIKDMDIVNYDILHDAACPVGYTIICGNKRASVTTDLGCFTSEVKENIKDSQVLLIESNHDVEMLKFGPYSYDLKRRILSDVGHLSNEACGNALLELLQSGNKKVVLGHLSETNNHPDLAYETVLSVLRDNGVLIGKEVELSMAHRGKPSNYIEF